MYIIIIYTRLTYEPFASSTRCHRSGDELYIYTNADYAKKLSKLCKALLFEATIKFVQPLGNDPLGIGGKSSRRKHRSSCELLYF